MTQTATPPRLTVRLTFDDGTTEDVSVVFDFSDLDVDQVAQVRRLYEVNRPPSDDPAVNPASVLAGICIFAQLGRPDEDWPALAALLTGIATANSDIVIEGE